MVARRGARATRSLRRDHAGNREGTTMNGMRIAGIASAAAALGGGLWFYQRAEAREAPAYRTAAVERADLQSTVSATGALSAVRTVQVGTQVSGQVSAIYVDFNDKVRKGQLLARI